MTTLAGSLDAVAVLQRVDDLRSRIEAASQEAVVAFVPEVDRVIAEVEAERARDQAALDSARQTYASRYGAGQRLVSRLPGAFGAAGAAAEFRRSVIRPIADEVAADERALAGARRLKNVGSADHWYNGTGHGSAAFWYRGSGLGSAEFWYRGEGRGSAQFWYNGTGPGSAQFWYNGTGPGSASFWYNGRGPGSAAYWYNGPQPGDAPSLKLAPWLNAVIRKHVDDD